MFKLYQILPLWPILYLLCTCSCMIASFLHPRFISLSLIFTCFQLIVHNFIYQRLKIYISVTDGESLTGIWQWTRFEWAIIWHRERQEQSVPAALLPDVCTPWQINWAPSVERSGARSNGGGRSQSGLRPAGEGGFNYATPTLSVVINILSSLLNLA